jgi:hypothetical protein
MLSESFDPDVNPGGVPPQVAEIRVTSWSELQNELFRGSWDPAIGRFRSSFAFRGLSDATYRLATTLFRLGGDYAPLEKHLLRNFRKYAHRQMVERDSVWHWLSIAQHHGLPTRLLDWTYSPLISMHFATANTAKMNIDGAIWSVNYVNVNRAAPEPICSMLAGEGSNAFTVDMLTRISAHLRARHSGDHGDGETFRDLAQSLSDFDMAPGEDFLIFFEPPAVDDRIVNQFALFSVLSNPTRLVDDWLARHPEWFRKIIIPSELKWEIRDKLDQSNITERVLFPGLDGLTAWLKRHYSPRED